MSREEHGVQQTSSELQGSEDLSALAVSEGCSPLDDGDTWNAGRSLK